MCVYFKVVTSTRDTRLYLWTHNWLVLASERKTILINWKACLIYVLLSYLVYYWSTYIRSAVSTNQYASCWFQIN